MIGGTSLQVKLLVFALALTILTPFFAFFVPLAYFETVYVHIESWLMMIPMRNFILLGVGCFGFIIILVLFAWKRQIITYILGAVLLVGSIFIVFQSQRNYISFQESGIEMLSYGNVKNYRWKDMKNIVYEVYYNDVSYYIFQMGNGHSFEITENGQLMQVRGKLLSTIREHEIPYTENYHE